jgi:hypothetical protein
MSKIKVTRKHVNALFRNVYQAGYCELQDILSRSDATYYNCGVYGWNWDGFTNYEFDACITTGYRNMTGKRVPAELVKKYSEKAREIKEKFRWDRYEEKAVALAENERNFWSELVATV